MIARPLPYGDLEDLWEELSMEDHLNNKSDFYFEQLSLLSKVLENAYGTPIDIVGVENLEAVWYNAIRHYKPLRKFIKMKIKGKAMEPEKQVDRDHAVWAFVVESVKRHLEGGANVD